jgi:hypothetical protein
MKESIENTMAEQIKDQVACNVDAIKKSQRQWGLYTPLHLTFFRTQAATWSSHPDIRKDVNGNTNQAGNIDQHLEKQALDHWDCPTHRKNRSIVITKLAMNVALAIRLVKTLFRAREVDTHM